MGLAKCSLFLGIYELDFTPLGCTKARAGRAVARRRRVLVGPDFLLHPDRFSRSRNNDRKPFVFETRGKSEGLLLFAVDNGDLSYP